MLVLGGANLPSIDLDDQAEGYICEAWALGPPTVRDVSENRTLANGSLDWTAFVGNRALTMSVVCFPNNGLTVQGQIDRLAAYCNPARRPTLTWQFDSDPARQVTLRANPGLDVEYSTNSYAWRRVGLSFVVPDALQWAAVEETREVFPTAGDAEVGRTYDLVFDRVYPASTANSATLINPGEIAVPWVANIYGPCTNPRLYNDTQGRGILLTAGGGLSLNPGEFVTIDSANRSITQGGANRYNKLDVANSDWWGLGPGANEIRLQPTTFSAGCVAEITWRHAWL